jgi:multidrug efflux pump subunit AcrB
MPDTSENMNLIGKVSYFFAVNRPLSFLVLFVALFFGLLAFVLTPKQYNPEIIRPAFSISIAYEGATQQEAIDRVVYELVEKIIAVPGVEDVFTEVSDDARVQTTVIFEVGYEATQAKVDLLSQIEQHEYLARGFIQKPQIIEINPETIPVLQVVFGSDTMSIGEVRAQVVSLTHQLTNIDAVSGVEVISGYTPALILLTDPVAMATQQVSVSDVLRVLRDGQTRFQSAGFVGEKNKVSFTLDGRAASAAEVGALQIRKGLQIRDIALVYEGTSVDTGYVLHDTALNDPSEVVVLAVSKVEGSSAPVVTEEIRDVINAAVQTDKFKNLSYVVVGDDGATAQAEIFGLTWNLVTSIAIVVSVLLLFLSFRTAAVVFIAIPVTLLIVFAIGYLFDQTINRITLFALILSLGLLVDSAIVVVENIYEHLRRASEQTISATREIIIAKAVQEVGVGLLLSAVTSVIVFLPMRYITGMMGPYMGPIAFFVPLALVVSFVVAIVVVPFVATSILHTNQHKSTFATFIDRAMQRTTALYQRILSRILYSRAAQKKILLGALTVFIVSLALPMSGLVHFQMLPRADRDQLYVYVDAQVDTPTEYTREIAADISNLFTEDPDVVSVQQFIAQAPALDFNGMFKGAQNRFYSYQATMRVNLVSVDNRKRSSTAITTDLRSKLAEAYPEYVSKTRFIEEPPGPPVRATLVAKVTADTAEVQRAFAETMYTFFGSVEGVVDRYSSKNAPVGRIVYTLNRDKAQLYDVPVSSITESLRLIGGSIEATEYLASDAGEFTPVVLTLPYDYTNEPADIAHIRVRAGDGSFVPITSVIDTRYEENVSRVSFERTQSFTYVTGEVQDRSIVYVVIESMYKLIRGEVAGYTVTDWNLFSMQLTDASGAQLGLHWGGEWEMTLENFRDLGIAMGVALLLVYVVLVAKYNSFSKPAYILVTIPLGLVGILWGFFLIDSLFNIYLTATALIGFIALIGLVVNNAIIYLEYVEQSEKKGLSFEESLLAAGEARLRPIFLTSLTTVLGSLVIVNDPVWSGLAWAIIFGLSLSTLLTLVIYPTLLAYFHTPEKL